jgi:hypothetical protein
MPSYSTVAEAIIYAREGATGVRQSNLIKGAATIKDKYGAKIEKYRGDVPSGFAYTRIWHESGGKTTVATSHGEVGLLQVWDWQANSWGITDKTNTDQNLWAGFGNWNYQARALAKKYGFKTGTEDFWKIVYVALNIGTPLVQRILDYQKTQGINPSYGALVLWVQTADLDKYQKLGWYGSQSAATVSYRIMFVENVVPAASRHGTTTSQGTGQSYGKWSSTSQATPSKQLSSAMPLALGGLLLLYLWRR